MFNSQLKQSYFLKRFEAMLVVKTPVYLHRNFVERNGHYLIGSVGKTLNALFLPGTLFGVDDSKRILFTMAYTGEKNVNTSRHVTAGIYER